MIQLLAPHPNYEAIILMPNPAWGDFRRLVSTVQVKRSMTGQTIVTHVQKYEDLRSFDLSFELTREKSLEFLAFCDSHLGSLTKMIDHRDDEFIGYLQVNPIELEKVRSGKSLGEVVTISFQFESVE